MHSTGDEFITDQKIIDSVKKYLVRFFHEGKVSGFPILSKIDHNIATQIWITACQFIEKQLESDKAVTVSQLGTFSFSSKEYIFPKKFLSIYKSFIF